MKSDQNPDYTTVTETPGVGASQQQLSMQYSRYKFAAELCEGKDVLEVACGVGQGLGLMAKKAKRVVGGDIDDGNLIYARKQYEGRPNIEVIKVDAHELPFNDQSFDFVILFEAIYYLERPDQFIKECARVLRPGGLLLICSVNKEWSDFNPSPFSKTYLSARELSELFLKHQFQVQVFGAFPVDGQSLRSRVISQIKRFAVKFHLIPKTMKGKEWLKRIVFGPLAPLPAEIGEGAATYAVPVPLQPSGPCSNYKVIYVKGRL